MKDMVGLFCELVRIDSESGQEATFIAFLMGLFERELGAHCSLDDYGNLIACVPRKDSQKTESILLSAHADTVKPGKGIEPVVADGVIRSTGETILGADNKAGIVEILEAIRTADKRPPVEIVITRGEETGLIGAKNLDQSKVQSRMGFVLDGEELDTIIVGGPTYVSVDVQITGKAAHAGMEPEKGISAIRVASEAIAGMPEGRIDEETTTNVGTIQGGLVRNGVPEKVTIQAECRSLNHEKCIHQADVMRKAFEKAAEKMGANADVKLTIEFRAAQIAEEVPTVQAAKAAVASIGLEPKLQVITGGTDALILNEKGIPAVVLGCGCQAPHSQEEHIAVGDMEKAMTLIRYLLHSLA